MAGLFRLNRFLPRTLFARALMLLVIPIAVVQAVTIYLLFDRHGETVTRRLALSLGGEIALLIRTQGYFSPEAQATMTDMTLRNLELDVTWEPEAFLKLALLVMGDHQGGQLGRRHGHTFANMDNRGCTPPPGFGQPRVPWPPARDRDGSAIRR